MHAWKRSTSGRLTRIPDSLLISETSSNTIMVGNDGLPPQPPHRTTLQQVFYPEQRARRSPIVLPDAAGSKFEVRTHLIGMLPKFNGNYDEDAYEFLQEFEDLCSTISFNCITRDGILLRVIPFALKSNAKKWFNSLPAETIHTWDEFVSLFLKKYFPRSKSIELRTQIIGFHPI